MAILCGYRVTAFSKTCIPLPYDLQPLPSPAAIPASLTKLLVAQRLPPNSMSCLSPQISSNLHPRSPPTQNRLDREDSPVINRHANTLLRARLGDFVIPFSSAASLHIRFYILPFLFHCSVQRKKQREKVVVVLSGRRDIPQRRQIQHIAFLKRDPHRLN